MKTQNILLAFTGLIIADYMFAKINTKPNFIIKDELPFNYNAQTIPPFGIFITKEQSHNKKLIEHEMTHWKQYNKMGSLLFLLSYLIEKGVYGYDEMPLEIEARKKVGESVFCQKNYSYCVKNGHSITVKNNAFRSP